MKIKGSASGFSELFKKAKSDWRYKSAQVKLEFAVGLTRAMKRHGINRSELARRLETTPAYITKLLRGDANVSIDTMVKAVGAVSSDLCLHVADHSAKVRWLEEYSNQNAPSTRKTWERQSVHIKTHSVRSRGAEDVSETSTAA